MSEAELHLLFGRLQGAKRTAAQRGKLRLPLPVGLEYDPDGLIMLDSDEQVRQAVADVFAEFARTGSAYGVVRAFVGHSFPLRVYGGVWAGSCAGTSSPTAGLWGCCPNRPIPRLRLRATPHRAYGPS